ncbi:MAG: twin-arginine translocase TatA/TatE family subunit [Chloroflexi bacterium]|nr:twin-arginine translocase TatA/TatE family subunit [Chloroflexota bacterium]
MEILGVGASELVFILIIALIILGPKDMQKAGRTIGKWLRGIVTSDGWKVFQQTSRELRTLPNRLMREANEELGDVGKELKSATDLIKERSPRVSVSTSQFQQAPAVPPAPADNKIEPPSPAETKANESDSKADA